MVAKQSQMPQRSKSLRIECEDLSYQTMTVRDCGTMITREEKESLRQRYGYCTTCPGVPILLFNKGKSRLNPFTKKEPRTADGECLEGACLRCHPEKDPRRQKFAAMKTPSLSSSNKLTGNHSKKDFQRDLSNGALALSQSRRDLFQRDPSNASFSKTSSRKDITRENSSESMGSPHLGSRKSPQPSPRLANARKSLNQAYDADPNSKHHVTGSSPRLGSRRSPQQSPSIGSARKSIHQKSPKQDGLGKSMYLDRKSNATTSKSHAHASSLEHGKNHKDTIASMPPPPPPPAPEDLKEVDKTTGATQQMRDGLLMDTYLQPSSDLRRSSTFGSTIRSSSSIVPQLRESKSLSSCPETTTAVSSRTTGDGGPIRLLESFFQGSTTSEDYDLLIKVVLNAMRSNSDQEPIQLLCLRSVIKICKQGYQNKERFSRSKVMEAIAITMQRFDSSSELQQIAAETVSTLAGNSQARVALVQNGVCTVLVKSLRTFAEDFFVIGPTIAALRALSLEPASRQVFESILASKYVSEAMEKHSYVASLQRDSCAFLSNVSVDMGSQDVSAVSRDLLKAIVNALKAHKEQESVVSVACFALRNLSYDQKNLRTLRNIEEVASLLETVGNSEFSCVQDAFDVLERLQMSQAEDESLEEHALESLKVLVELKEGAPEAIADARDLMKNFEWSAKVSAECFECLRSLASKSEQHKQAILSSDGIQEVVRQIKQNETSLLVLERGYKLLAVILQDSDSSQSSLFDAKVHMSIVEAMEKHAKTGEFLEAALSALDRIISCVENWDCQEQERIVDVLEYVIKSQRENTLILAATNAILSKLGR